MPTEVLAPDSIISLTNLSGAVGDIDDDPSSPDANWLTASGNNVNTECYVSFPTPMDILTPGSGLQTITAAVRQFDEGQNGTPDARIELWENGSLVSAGSDTAVGTGTTVINYTFDARSLTLNTGANVECKIIGTKAGGSPSNRNTVEVGAVEFTADYLDYTSLQPNAILATDGNWTGSLSDLQDSTYYPDSNDYQSDESVSGNQEFRAGLATPPGTITGTQKIRVFLRNVVVQNNSSSPFYRIFLYENGSLVLAFTGVVSGIDAYSENTFIPSNLSDQTGADVEVLVRVQANSENNERFDVGAIEWVYQSIAGPTLGMSLKGG